MFNLACDSKMCILSFFFPLNGKFRFTLIFSLHFVVSFTVPNLSRKHIAPILYPNSLAHALKWTNIHSHTASRRTQKTGESWICDFYLHDLPPIHLWCPFLLLVSVCSSCITHSFSHTHTHTLICAKQKRVPSKTRLIWLTLKGNLSQKWF